jgi:hypothetical protein
VGVIARALVVTCALAASANAAPWTAVGEGGVAIDWSAGTLRAKGIGPADRHAPSPAVARVGAKRAAEIQARAKLLKAARALKVADGGSVGAAIDKDAKAKARLEGEIERAPVVETDLLTDGSARVTLTLGIEAVRQALSGSRTATTDESAVVWIVDAKSATPAVGWALKVGGTRWDGPVLFARDRSGAPADAVAAKATSATDGVLSVSGPTAPPPAGALVVVVVPEK